MNLILKTSMEHKFAENISNTLREQGRQIPQADSLLRHLKKHDSIEEIYDIFLLVFEVLWNEAKRTGIFDRKVNIGIDITDIAYYGKPNSMCIGKSPKKPKKDGANNCFRFATVDIVDAESRFTVYALPMNPLEKKEDVLEKLLKFVKKRITIKRVYIDRGFYSVECINVFNKLGLKFLMPAVRNQKVLEYQEIITAPDILPYEMKNVKNNIAKFNLIFVTDEKNNSDTILLFATNEEFDKNADGFSKNLCYLYNKRWGIETGYRVKKEFLAKTTSRNYFIRLYYFLFSCLIYNLWIIADILLSFFIFGRKKKSHVITAWNFLNYLFISGFG